MKKILITVADPLIQRMNDFCEKNGYTRSEFARAAFRQLLDAQDTKALIDQNRNLSRLLAEK